MPATRKKTSRTKINFLIDLTIFVAFLVAMDPRLTGIAIHEWLSIAFGAAIIVHLLLHWQWLAATTKRFLGKVAGQARLNYILNALFFIDMTLIIFTGVMISESALPSLGIRFQPNFFWRWLHTFSADMGVYILGLHVALHWKWLWNAFKRYVLRPFPIPSFRLAQKKVQI
ncbi:MAG: DUF4405 domain-containing protein [Ardenticatenaceae bacterium]|nr:DUF4405 domain-containing protein [Ardenticatenaceae bacterium]